MSRRARVRRRVPAQRRCSHSGQCSVCGGTFPDWNGGVCSACKATNRKP